MLPWVEKYRPKTISEVSHQINPVSALNQIVKTLNMPHLIFYGPPGTGKTSAALALARQLFGKDGLKERILELNASDDRGIDVVREKIKTYARLNISKNRINPETGKPMPPWKIVILDEADMMTSDAQAALRRAIENYSTITRFIFICNYIYKIIDPLCSRCSLQRFQPIAKQAQISRLVFICEQEKISSFTNEAMEALVRVSQGDLRRSITLLQTIGSLYKNITEDIVYDIAGIPPRVVVIDLLKSCKGTMDDVDTAVKIIIDQGWDVSDIMSQICDIVANDVELDDISKARISLELSNRDFALFQGASQYFQLLSLCHHIREIVMK